MPFHFRRERGQCSLNEDHRQNQRVTAHTNSQRKEIEDGLVAPIPGEEVMERLRARYKR